MNRPQNYTLYLRYIEFQESCPFILDHVRTEFNDYFVLRERFHVLLNHFFYKWLRGISVNLKRVQQKWAELTVDYRTSYIAHRFRDQLPNVIALLERNLDVKCIANPVNMDIDGVRICGNLDIVTRHDDVYDVYFLVTDDANQEYVRRVIPGLVGMAFYYDFHELKFNVIVHNIATNQQYIVRDAGLSIGSLFNRSKRLLEKNYQCGSCLLKNRCVHESNNNDQSHV